jgi:hypothetical protein
MGDVTIECVTVGCSNTHTLSSDDYKVIDGRLVAPVYMGKCPTCRERFDAMITEVRAVEESQTRAKVKTVESEAAAVRALSDQVWMVLASVYADLHRIALEGVNGTDRDKALVELVFNAVCVELRLRTADRGMTRPTTNSGNCSSGVSASRTLSTPSTATTRPRPVRPSSAVFPTSSANC